MVLGQKSSLCTFITPAGQRDPNLSQKKNLYWQILVLFHSLHADISSGFCSVFFIQFYLLFTCTRRIIQQSHQSDNKTPSSLITLAQRLLNINKNSCSNELPTVFYTVCMRMFTPSHLGDTVSCVVKATACMNDLYSIRPITVREHSRTYTVKTLAIWLKVIKQSPSLLWPLSRLAEFPCMWSKNHEAMTSANKKKNKKNPTSTAGWRAEVSGRLVHYISISEI